MQLTLRASALAALVAVGCGPATPPTPPPRDAGMRDAATVVRDAGVDALVEDGGDAGEPMDVGPVDAPDIDADQDVGPADAAPTPDAAFVFDAGPPIDAARPDANLDGGPCELPDGGYNFCACGDYGRDCSTASCAGGTACLSDPCGMHCAPAGEQCTDGADCAATSVCSVAGTCAHPGGGCADSRDCPPGHSCDSGACQDRRVGCRPVEGFDCPWGFVCETGAVPFCLRTLRRCGGAAACEADSRCLDIDGDGARECSSQGTCMANSECTGGLVCGTRPDLRFTGCERYGPCRTAADCSAGMACHDLWGDGIRECVEPGGCTAQTDCPGQAICATPAMGGPPACLSTPLGT